MKRNDRMLLWGCLMLWAIGGILVWFGLVLGQQPYYADVPDKIERKVMWVDRHLYYDRDMFESQMTALVMTGWRIEYYDADRIMMSMDHDVGDVRFDVNTASVERLESITGIGPAIAAGIVEKRPFGTLEDLLSVPGIGPAKLQTITPFLKVGSE